MQILLTGGASFIGLAITRLLAENGFNVIATFKGRSTDSIRELELKYSNVKYVCLDISDRQAFLKLPGRIDAVIHCAAVSPSTNATVDNMISGNIIGTRNVHSYGLDAEAKLIVFLSSISVYGEIKDSVVNETTGIRNPSFYGVSKYLGERILASNSHELPVIALRLPGVVGSGALNSWIPTLVHKMQQGLPIRVRNAEDLFNSVIHVKNLAIFILNILKIPLLTGFHAFPIASVGEMPKYKIVRLFHDRLLSNAPVEVDNTTECSSLISSVYALDNFKYTPWSVERVLSEYCMDILIK